MKVALFPTMLVSLIRAHPRVTFIIFIIAAALLYGAFGGVWKKSEETTLTLEPKEFLQQVSVSGKILAADNVALSFEGSGRVSSVLVKEGDKVRVGATLVQLDSSSLNADLRSALAEVAVKRIQLENRGVNLGTVQKEQDTLVESARRTLYSEGLAAVPASNTYKLKSPIISGAYQGDVQGDYTVQAAFRYLGSSDMMVQIFDMESVDKIKVPDNEPVKLGTRGLYLSFPDGPEVYNDTKWYISVPNVKSSSYLSNFNAYQKALRARDKAIGDAQAELSGRSVGTTIATAELSKAESEVERIRAELTKRTLRAPFSGVVTAVGVQVGETVSVNNSAVSLISADDLKIDSYVPEINISNLSVGDPANITLDAYGEEVTFPAQVASIDPAETLRDGVTTYRVTLLFTATDKRVRSGMTANILITTDRRAGVITVPQGAVQGKDGRRSVTLLLANGTREERKVTLGAVSSLGEVEILSGVVPGEKVVLLK